MVLNFLLLQHYSIHIGRLRFYNIATIETPIIRNLNTNDNIKVVLQT